MLSGRAAHPHPTLALHDGPKAVHRFTKLRLSTRALRTLRRMSIEDYARKNGLDLAKL